jgi:hypothetical protein
MHCCSGRTVSITYSECVCVCSFSFPACKAHDFRKNDTEYVLIFSGTFLILRRIQRGIIVCVHRSSYKVPVFRAVFQSSVCILGRNIQMASIIKIRSLGAELLHADGRQADLTNLSEAIPLCVNLIITLIRYIYN